MCIYLSVRYCICLNHLSICCLFILIFSERVWLSLFLSCVEGGCFHIIVVVSLSLSFYLFFPAFVLLDFLVYLTSAILYFSFLLNKLTVPKFAKNCKVQILDVMLPFLWSLGWCLRWSDATRAPLKLSAWNFPLKISNIPYTIYKHVEYSIYFMPNQPLSQLLWFLFFFFFIYIFIIWNVPGPRSELAHDLWAVSRVAEGV